MAASKAGVGRLAICFQDSPCPRYSISITLPPTPRFSDSTVVGEGGHIQIDSSIDSGTRVSVTLPPISTDATLEKESQILSHP